MNQYIPVDPESSYCGQPIPEFDEENFPGVPIEERYSTEFLSTCVVKSEEYLEEIGFHAGMLYDHDTDTFSEPPEPEPGPTPPSPEPVPPSPSAWDALEAQVMYTALITDTLIDDAAAEEG